MILPYKVDVEWEDYPYVTLGLIGVNVLVFLLMTSMSYEASRDFVYSWSFVWFHFHPSTLITSLFIHAGFAHLFGNMWFLWLYGPGLEEELNGAVYLMFYLAIGVLSSIIHGLSLPMYFVDIRMLGASGAISGIMGAFFLLHSRAEVKHFVWYYVGYFTFQLPAWFVIGYWFAMQTLSSQLSGETSSVAYVAHVSGFLLGFLGIVGIKHNGDILSAFKKIRGQKALRELERKARLAGRKIDFEDLETVYRKQPNNPYVNYWYGVNALRFEKPDSARDAARSSLELFSNADKSERLNAFLLQSAMGLEPESGDKALEFSEALRDTENYQESFSVLERFESRYSVDEAMPMIKFRQGQLLSNQLDRQKEAYELFNELDQAVDDSALSKEIYGEIKRIEPKYKDR